MTSDLAFDLQGHIYGQRTVLIPDIVPKLCQHAYFKIVLITIASLPGQFKHSWPLTLHLTFKVKFNVIGHLTGYLTIIPKLRCTRTEMVSNGS